MSLNFTNLTSNLYPISFGLIDATLSKAQSNKTILIAQQEPKIVSTRGFDFEFIGCEAISTDEFTCSFIVVNNQEPRTLQLFTKQSKIVDGEANEFYGSLARLGAANGKFDSLMGQMGAMNKLPTHVPVKGEVLFRNVPSGTTTKINYIEFNFSQFKVWFTPGQ